MLEPFWSLLEVHEVDSSIDVLISAGMSSPALRKVARAGVDIESRLPRLQCGSLDSEELELQQFYLTWILHHLRSIL